MRKQWSGNAVGARLTGPLNPGDNNFTVDLATGWPTTGPYVVVVDRGTAIEEKILIASRSSTTHTVQTHGWDSTVPQAHAAGATVEHCIDADTIDEANDHVNNPLRDDHGQYLTSTRHANPSYHLIGTSLPTPNAPAQVSDLASPGTSGSAAREDHVHTIAAGAINQPVMLADNVVDERSLDPDTFLPGGSIVRESAYGGATDRYKVLVHEDIAPGASTIDRAFGMIRVRPGGITDNEIADDAVVPAKIPDGSILPVKIDGNYELIYKGASFPPTPDADDICWRTDERVLYVYDGATWVPIYENGVRPWTAAAPTWTGTGTPPTFGGGATNTLRFRVADGILYCSYRFVFANSTHNNSTAWQFTIPAGYEVDLNGISGGTFVLTDAGTNRYRGNHRWIDETHFQIVAGDGSAGLVGYNFPFAWANGCSMSGSFFAELAVAP